MQDLINSLQQDTQCSSQILSLLSEGMDLNGLLHLAVEKGNLEAVQTLLSAGAPWNTLDENNLSVGDVALKNGFVDLYEFLVAEGARTEFLLTLLGIQGNESGMHRQVSNAEYLDSKLEFSGNQILDSDKNGVMMGWEEPLMKVHADIICPRKGLRILNVGFGMGIIDLEIQKKSPLSHTIIEAHPDVYKKMIQDGWDKIDGVEIIFGRWQDVLDQLQVYDGVFFDTFGEYYDDLKEFHDYLPNILDENGVYSYFNGLAGTNMFFHDVACKIAECDLNEIGFSVEYKTLRVDDLGDDVWKGIKRAYWSLPIYKVPICRLMGMSPIGR